MQEISIWLGAFQLSTLKNRTQSVNFHDFVKPNNYNPSSVVDSMLTVYRLNKRPPYLPTPHFVHKPHKNGYWKTTHKTWTFRVQESINIHQDAIPVFISSHVRTAWYKGILDPLSEKLGGVHSTSCTPFPPTHLFPSKNHDSIYLFLHVNSQICNISNKEPHFLFMFFVGQLGIYRTHFCHPRYRDFQLGVKSLSKINSVVLKIRELIHQFHLSYLRTVQKFHRYGWCQR